MGRAKLTARRGRPARMSPDSQESPPDPACVASLVKFVQSLPDESGERPAKRAKALDSTPSVTVACRTLDFIAESSTPSLAQIHVSRKNVGEHLRIGCRWGPFLCLAPQKKSKDASFQVELPLDAAKLEGPQSETDSLSTVLDVAWRQCYDPKLASSVWAAVDIAIVQVGTCVDIKVQVNVQWTESQNMDRTTIKPQLEMRSAVMVKCLGLDCPLIKIGSRQRARSVSQPPTIQDFYDAASVPDPDDPGSDLPSAKIAGLTARLYPFQRRAVQWLLKREGVQWLEPKPADDSVQAVLAPYQPDLSKLPVSFTQIKDAIGNPVAISPLFGMIVKDPTPFHHFQNVRGGILAEEMGLGKTVEMTSLILLHRRPAEPETVYDPYLGRQLCPTKATLIVTPPSLLDQWLSELARHAPQLKVMHYRGLRRESKFFEDSIAQEFVQELAQYDVVVTTYDVLGSELKVAVDPPGRSMRHAKTYKRATSPLVQLSWWRVCIDEAQMIENWRTNTALMARLIPRVNAWAITGTPVKDSVQEDLRGLLAFLRFEPYATDHDVWKTFTTYYRDIFQEVFNLICIRHTKRKVREDMKLPAQRRYIITMPFSAVEEQHYQNMFQVLVNSLGLDITGTPIEENWNPNDPAVQQGMRFALDRLRQIVLQPGTGISNKRAFGRRVRDRPLRTVAEVLDAMLEQSEASLWQDQRKLLSVRHQRGQVLAKLGKNQDALAVWEEVKRESASRVDDCRVELQKQIQAAYDANQTNHTPGENPDPPAEESPEGGSELVDSRVAEARRRLRSALEVQHRAVFCCANAYYSIKTDTAAPDSEEFARLEKLETEGYELAKTIRMEILQEPQSKAKRLMGKLAAGAADQTFAVIPEMGLMDQYGIESRRIAQAFEGLGGILNDQAGVLDEWREHVIQLLLKSLVDDETEAVTGEEYDQSTKLSDELLVYVQALKTVLADRYQYLSGQTNELVDFEYLASKGQAEEGKGPCPAKLRELFAVRDELKPDFEAGDKLGSLRGVISTLRGLATKLDPGSKMDDSAPAQSRSAAEFAIVSNLLKQAQKQLTEQVKATTLMEQEAALFTDTMNARIEFYRQLQAVSDTVADYDGDVTDKTLAAFAKQQETAEKALSAAEAKHRYLVHLKQADSQAEEQRLCTICQETFSVGVLTICGHQFCKECLMMWFNLHRSCPLCKRGLSYQNLHDITLKPQELKIHSESTGSPSKRTSSPKKTGIYSELNPERLAEIKNIDLDGPNYTTKVDTLVRHLMWLREHDPGAKSIIFSQYQEFLLVLREAFTRYRIGFTSFADDNGIKRFKEDPGIEVFLLHARAHSSGLNLVVASHVFLCEPILNTALELQAIARVDRIGQHHETTVWLYLVEGTVEESIYNLSVQRRMEHMGRNLKGKSTSPTPELLDDRIEEANSMELQQASLSKLMGKGSIVGEAVNDNDLWTCLFGHVQAALDRERQEKLRSDPTVRGFLAAEAAEARLNGEEESST